MKLNWKYIVAAIVVLCIGWVWFGYNGLISTRGAVQASWADVQTTYQRRMDLIPSLASTVKGAAKFEQDTFREVTEARTKWMSAGSRSEQVTAAQGFDSALSRLLVTVENYPQLKATQAFQDFMTQLEGTENRINTARHDYTDAVMQYNILIQRFPRNLLANLFGFGPEAYFQSTQGAENAPKVTF